MPTQTPWFKSDVVYQIYPKSFADFDGDGLGDLLGVESKIDYLKSLGIGAVWFSPFYPSPQADNGYDISNYVDIDPRFGTLEDFDRIVEKLHGAGIKVIVDVVFNHSSEAHPWFLAALEDVDSPYRDYYMWRDGVIGHDGTESAPNNWTAFFGGSSWSKRGAGDQYYLHTFTPEQPDLNWENPVVRAEIAAIMNFWIDRGVDGFRMDVINLISKHPELPDGALDGPHVDTVGIEHYGFGPRLVEFLTELRMTVVDPRNAANELLPKEERRAQIALIGETPGLWPDLARFLVQDNGGPLDMIFHFEHMGVDQGSGGKFDIQPFQLTALKEVLGKWHTAYGLDAWNSQYFGNHDQPRVATRWGKDSPEAAKALAAMLLLSRGTPFVYQGDEIGMTNAKFTAIDQYDDIESINRYAERIAAGQDSGSVLEAIGLMGRDNARTPVRWSTEEGYGFTSGTPWLGFGQMDPSVAVSAQESEPGSVLNFYRKLIALRREHCVFVDGTFEFLALEDRAIWAVERGLLDESASALVMVNFSDGPVSVPAEVEARWPIFDVALGSHSSTSGAVGSQGARVLEPYEVVIAIRNS